MKTLAHLAIGLPLVLCGLHAEDSALLAIPGKVIYESKLDQAPGAPWKSAKGKWELANGVLRGSELEADQHGAVTRLPNKLQDFVIEVEVRLDGARVTTLSINGDKDHMARILITPKLVTIQRDDNDHEGPDKSVVFARFAADLGAGWHKVRLEMVGDKMLGKVDDLLAWGASDLFKNPKMSPGFTVGGASAEFRNLTIREATLNPYWEKAQAKLPAPGSKLAAPAKAKAEKKD
jgi:outer membrane scaffolding protein for murein synthesis (MipA/OmpV family)